MDDLINVEGCGSGRSGCKNPPSEPHSCPFAEEIDDDFEDNCTCCEECTDKCADDI